MTVVTSPEYRRGISLRRPGPALYVVLVDLRPTTVEELLVDLEAEHLDLDVLVAPLDEIGWNRPTPAAGWAVRDQVSHLAYFDDAAYLAMTEPAVFAKVVDAAMAADDPKREHLLRGRAMSGVELLTWWRSSRSAMIGASADLPDGTRVPWFGPPMGVLSFLSARLMETWAHGQDVADALRVQRVPTPRLRHIAHLGVRARPFSYAVRGLPLPPTSVSVALTGPGGEHWAWDHSDSAEDSVRGPALDFCLVVTQRRNLADTALVVEGPAATEWMSIAQAFAGPPGPGRPAEQAS
jgi:uncharacterized protein (TIGR03084 family)